ncbi:tryptophan synthase subunit alpha [soil metagenome]
MSASPSGETRIARAFANAEGAGRAAFVPYLTAGFPDARTSLAAARTLLRHADLLELGLPFSDPLGDGPTIQRASEVALAAGTRTRDVFDTLRTLRAETDVPLVVMTYYNPIYCYRGPAGEGEGAFVRDVRAAGADGLILPDLPPDEGATLIAEARSAGLATVFLVAPTSTEARLRLVSEACRGFVYAVSVTGVTGAREGVGGEIADLVRRTKAVSDLPVAVGFGVATPADAASVAAFADAVVVGSKLVQTVADGGDLDAIAAVLAAACSRAGAGPAQGG